MATKVLLNCNCCCRILVDCGCNSVPCTARVYFNSCCIPFPEYVTVYLRNAKTKGLQSECDCIGFFQDSQNLMGGSEAVAGRAVWTGFGDADKDGCSGLPFRVVVTVTYNCPESLTGNGGGTWSIEMDYYQIIWSSLGGTQTGPLLFTINPTIDTTTCSSALNGKPGFTFTFTDDEITGTVPSCFNCSSVACCGGFNDSSCTEPEPEEGTIDVNCCENLLPETLTGTITNVSGCSGFTEGQTIEFSYAGSSEWRANNIGISCKSAGFSNWSLTCSGLSSSDFTLSMNHTFTNCSIAPIAPDVSSCSPINLVFLCDVPLCQCCNPAEDATFTLTITA